MNVILVGYGYVGRHYAELVGGGSVYGLSREEKQGIHWSAFDLDNFESLPDVPWEDSTVVYLAPPSRNGTQREEHFLQHLKGVRRIVYISATSVYGDVEGEWVTEESPVRPKSESGKLRLAAENAFQRYCDERGVELVILRVAGIYGPGRLPVPQVMQGKAVVKQSEAPYTNRIHIEDLVAVVAAAISGKPGIYNVSDGAPGKMGEMNIVLAELLGVPGPKEVSLDEMMKEASAMMKGFLGESKRVSNEKLLRVLGVALKHQDLKTSLKLII